MSMESRKHPRRLSQRQAPNSEPDGDASTEEEHSASNNPETKNDRFLEYLKKEWSWKQNFPDGYELTSKGLYKNGQNARGNPVTTFVGSPIAVVGKSREANGKAGWGRIIVFPDNSGGYVTLILPNILWVGDGKEARAALVPHGFICPNDRSGRLALADFINQSDAPDILEITSRPGWIGDSFALPQGIISPPDEKRHIKMNMSDKEHFFATAGSFEDWRALAGLVGTSSRAAFALSVAFAAVLLKPMGESGGGFHFYGNSSRSKTTFLVCAGSTFGGGGVDGYVLSWLRTTNSAEAEANNHNDCPFMLDEIGLSDPEKAADLFYMLANGQGKGRATVLGTAGPGVQWRSITLSSGEDSSAVHMRSCVRSAKKRSAGGAAVRMVDIPIQVAPNQSFEDIGNFESERVMAEYIGREARRVYGHAGPEFIKHLVADRETHLATAREIKERFFAAVVEPEDDKQVERIAGRFGVVAAAGELAVLFGVLPWETDDAFNAAVTCYRAWKNARGTSKSEEERHALSALRVFFELYGRSRFEAITPPQNLRPEQEVQREDDKFVRDRCGYRTVDDDGNALIYVTPEAFRSEVSDGHSPDIMLRVARECGALIVGDGAHLQKNVRLPDRSGTTRVYAFKPHKLD